ncbi:MAG: hypothetical protein OEM82_16200, partial [Acidobacteriota bacterium]|nr:hypothetical protein [Acidobacteriota bacterium]
DFSDRRFEAVLLGPLESPFASCLGDLISSRQVRIAKALAREASLDENIVSWNLFECDFAELSKKAAERLIAYLKSNGLKATSRVRLAG